MTNQRQTLLRSIATIIADYRQGEVPNIDSSHVNRWVRQFDEFGFDLDDCLYSGNTVRRDIHTWLSNAVRGTTLHLIFFALHTYGLEYSRREIEQKAQAQGVVVKFWWLHEFHNSRWNSSRFDCFWARQASGDELVDRYVQKVNERRQNLNRTLPPLFRPNNVPTQDSIFSSPTAREIVEYAFLKVGAYIVSLPRSPNTSMRPLGYDYLESLGFGAFFVTYRNIANNCPFQNWDKFSKLLLETGELPIVEDSRKDDFWGAKPEDAEILTGANVLGRLLMELREQVKNTEITPETIVQPLPITDFLLYGREINPISASGEYHLTNYTDSPELNEAASQSSSEIVLTDISTPELDFHEKNGLNSNLEDLVEFVELESNQYDTFRIMLPYIVESLLKTERTDKELAKLFEIPLKLMRNWLDRAVKLGKIRKLSKPVRYIVETQLSLLN